MVFEWDPDSMFLNYAAAGAYINIGGVNAENRAEVSLNEEKIKKVLTKYAQLKDAFGIALESRSSPIEGYSHIP